MTANEADKIIAEYMGANKPYIKYASIIMQEVFFDESGELTPMLFSSKRYSASFDMLLGVWTDMGNKGNEMYYHFTLAGGSSNHISSFGIREFSKTTEIIRPSWVEDSVYIKQAAAIATAKAIQSLGVKNE